MGLTSVMILGLDSASSHGQLNLEFLFLVVVFDAWVERDPTCEIINDSMTGLGFNAEGVKPFAQMIERFNRVYYWAFE